MKYKFINYYRLQEIPSNVSANHNWLFLPGGPGMGSEYLVNFVKNLRITGNVFIGDFPGDGSNRNVDNITYDLLKEGLIEVMTELNPCILVTHSFSGMFALTIPELEHLSSGLVLISSSPDNSWIGELAVTQEKRNLPSTQNAVIAFYQNPTNENLHKLFIACIPYLFHPTEIEDGKAIIAHSSFNAGSRLWADQNFHPTYKHTWVPQTLPTLIISSVDDNLLPAVLFQRDPAFARENIKTTILENTGHFPWLTHSEIIGKLLEDFEEKCSF